MSDHRSPARLSSSSLPRSSTSTSHDAAPMMSPPASAPPASSASSAAAAPSSAHAGPAPPRFTESLLNTALATALAVPTQSSAAPFQDNSGRRQPLSIQLTTQNFKRFVAKSGPLFWVSDQAESILLWDDYPKTIFFGLAWALICYKPTLLALLPSLVLMATLVGTFLRACPDGVSDPSAIKSAQGTTLRPSEAPAGSIDYLDNLQHIQEVMGRAASATDVGRSCLPFLDWTSHPRTSLYLFIFSCLASTLLLLSHHLVPWRLVLGIVGEAALLFGHPTIQQRLAPCMQNSSTTEIALRAYASDIRLKYDALPDEIVQQGPSAVLVSQVWEEESQGRDGQWAHHKLHPPMRTEAHNSSGHVERPPPAGYEWPEDGHVDWTVDYNLTNVDSDGWVTEGEAGQMKRRRRWLRIAVRAQEEDLNQEAVL